jgi:hypothetical protein
VQESASEAALRSCPKLTAAVEAAQNLELLEHRIRSPTGEAGYRQDLKRKRTAVAEQLLVLGFKDAMSYADQAAIE